MPARSIRFGDRRRATLLLRKFSQQTTLHGFHYLVGGLSVNWKRWLGRIFFVICLVVVIIGIYQLIETFLKEPTRVVENLKLYRDGPNIDPIFPDQVRITLCKFPPWRESVNDNIFVTKYGFTAFGFPFSSLTDDEISYLIYNDSSSRSYVNFPNFNSLKKKYDDLLKYRVDQIALLKNWSTGCKDTFSHGESMCTLYEPVLTIHGECFTRLFGGDRDTMIELLTPTEQSENLPSGYFVLVSHPLERIEFLELAKAKIIPPGFCIALTIQMALEKRDAIYTPWYSRTPNCPSLSSDIEPNITLRKLYGVESCRQRHALRYVEEQRNCSSILGINKPDQRRRHCFPDDVILSSRTLVKNVREGKMKFSCSLPCTEYTYFMDWKIAKMGKTNEIAQLRYTYDKEQFYLKQYEKVSINNALSQIGGFLGLYLGASIITILEIIQFLSKWIWYRVIPRRKQRVICTTKLQKLDSKNLRRLIKRQDFKEYKERNHPKFF